MQEASSESYRHRAAVMSAVLRGAPEKPEAGPRPTRREAMSWFAEEWSSLRAALDQAMEDRDFRDAAILGAELFHYLLAKKEWMTLSEVAEITAAAAHSSPVGNIELGAFQMLGIARQQMGDAERASDAFHRVLTLAGETNWLEQAPALAHLGQLALEQHDPHEAATLLRRAALLYQRAESKSGEALTLANLARVLRELGAFDESSAANRRALDLFAQEGDRVWEARTLLCVARDQFRNREVAAGRDSLVTALRMFEELALAADVIETQFMLAQVDFQLADKPSALAFAQAALSAAQATGHPDAAEIEAFLESLVWEDAVKALLQAATREEREAVITHYPTLLRPFTVSLLAQHLNESDGEAAEALNASMEFLRRYQGGLHERAVDQFWEHLRRLAPACSELPDSLREILSRCQDARDPNERISLLETAISMVLAEELAPVRGRLYYNLAGVCWQSLTAPKWQRAERAIEYAERALTLFDRNSEPVEWAEVHGLLGTLWRELPQGDHKANIDRALYHSRSALAVFRRNRYPQEWAETLVVLANAYRERRDSNRRTNIRRAIARHRAAQTVFTRSEFPIAWATANNSLGLDYLDEALAADPANVERARKLLLDALEALEPSSLSERASVEANLALCYSQRRVGDPDQNWHTQMRYGRAAYQSFEKLGESFEMAQLASRIGFALAHPPSGSRVDTEEAFEWYEWALSLSSARMMSRCSGQGSLTTWPMPSRRVGMAPAWRTCCVPSLYMRRRGPISIWL
jgi:tetratricopeptide (TPR) repeat protein